MALKPNRYGRPASISTTHCDEIEKIVSENRSNFNQVVNSLISEALDQRSKKNGAKNDKELLHMMNQNAKFLRLIFFTLKPAISEILEVSSMHKKELEKYPELLKIAENTRQSFDDMFDSYKKQLKGDSSAENHP